MNAAPTTIITATGDTRGRRSTAQVRAIAIGERAAQALAQCAGAIDAIEAFPDAPYMLAGGEIVWIGVRARSLHPRMIVLGNAPPPQRRLHVEASHLVPWSPSPAGLDRDARAHLVQGAVGLHARIREVAAPRGFGSLLVGARPAFPLDLAAPRVARFVAALADGAPAQIERTACALLGVGTGLTPSGDDLVGGALFARRLLTGVDRSGLQDDPLAQRLIVQAQARTHVISAALFADLAAGASYGLLHDVIDAMLHGSMATLFERVRALVAIGHSSGWDLLTGLIAALTAQAPDRLRIGIDTDG